MFSRNIGSLKVDGSTKAHHQMSEPFLNFLCKIIVSTSTTYSNPASPQLLNPGSDIEPSAREQRVLHDIKYTVVDVKADAEIKDCPECHARTKGHFPENMAGPL